MRAEQSMRVRIILAMQESKAWSTVFRSSAAMTLTEAALDALYEPTEKMLREMLKAGREQGVPDASLSAIWRAGIGAARDGK
jgi:hypothetical protein